MPFKTHVLYKMPHMIIIIVVSSFQDLLFLHINFIHCKIIQMMTSVRSDIDYPPILLYLFTTVNVQLVSFQATPLWHISSFWVQSLRRMLPWHCPGYHRDHSHHPQCGRSLMRLAVVAVTTDFELEEL